MELRTKIIKVLSQIVSDEKSTARERTSAARAVVCRRPGWSWMRSGWRRWRNYEDLVGRLEALEGETDGGLAEAAGGD